MKRYNTFISKTLAAFIISMIGAITAFAQTTPFDGILSCEETGVRLHLNLSAETIEVPGMSFLGPTNGYLEGFSNRFVYGVWMVINFKIENGNAKLRLTNDIGSDSQDIVLTPIDDKTFKYEAIGGNCIRKVEGRKLVKIPSTFILKKTTDL